ncbi:MAG: molybdopterin-binding protein [Acidobacteriota bacterium]|nr:molybdopterin-binding protein [Blastocatellia bacterium]MDW8241211.1 molybdopterin-binding protein [Acidobacteriota bacterium]
MSSRRRHIQLTPLVEAQRLFFDAVEELGFFATQEELIPVRQALGRVTSRPHRAARAVPHYRSAAMDGIAVCAEQTRAASQSSPLTLRAPKDFAWVNTGDPISEPFDAVIMVEQVTELEAGVVQISQPAVAGKNVRAVGEDFQDEETIVPAHYRITPEAIAALLSGAVYSVWVKRRPRALYIPTGSELAPPEEELQPGQIAETNSSIVTGYLTCWGAEVDVGARVSNDQAELKSALLEAVARFDLVLVGGGTSMGRDDLTPTVVADVGRVIVHGVAYHPGHPLLLGCIGHKPVIGLPGYPVAVWISLRLFLKPMLERYWGLPSEPAVYVEGRLAEPIKSAGGAVQFIRVRLEPDGDGWRVFKLPGGASRLSSVLRAHGLLEIPADVESLPAGASVQVLLLRPPA